MPPHPAALRRTHPGDLGGARPVETVEFDAARSPAAQLQADARDRLAAGLGRAHPQRRRDDRELDFGADHVVQLVVCPVDAEHDRRRQHTLATDPRDARRDVLARMQRGTREQFVGAELLAGARPHEGVRAHAERRRRVPLPSCGHLDREHPSPEQRRVDVVDEDAGHPLGRLEPLHRPPEHEREPRAVLRRERLLAAHLARHRNDLERLAHRVRDASRSLGAGQPDAVGDRAAPVAGFRGGRGRRIQSRRCVEARKTQLQAEQGTEIARIAVGVPAGGGRDREAAGEAARGVVQSELDERVVRDHVHVAAVTVVAVTLVNAGAGLPPVAVGGAPVAHVVDDVGDQRLARDEPERGVEQMVGAGIDEGLGLHRGHHGCRVERLAVVADRAGPPRQGRGHRGIARHHHPPAVDKDLRADLLGDERRVEFGGPAERRRDAGRQSQIRGVLCRVAEPAPPEDRAAVDEVVQPGLAELLGRDAQREAVIAQPAEEGEGAGDVVIGHDQRDSHAFGHVVVDQSIDGGQRLVVPTDLDRAPQVDADDLAEHAGIHTLGVGVVEGEHERERRCRHPADVTRSELLQQELLAALRRQLAQLDVEVVARAAGRHGRSRPCARRGRGTGAVPGKGGG